MNVLLHFVAIGIAVTFVADVCAQGFPSKPVRMLVGSNAGSGGDVLVRILAGP